MSTETISLIRDGEKGGKGVWKGGGEREIIYLSVHCRHQNDSYITMDTSDESRQATHVHKFLSNAILDSLVVTVDEQGDRGWGKMRWGGGGGRESETGWGLLLCYTPFLILHGGPSDWFRFTFIYFS